MADKPETRWAHRDKFAEVAEALGTTTDLIMAMTERKGDTIVMFTPGYPDDGTIWMAVLNRDALGILQVTHREPTGDVQDLQNFIERGMRERFGDP